MKLKTKLIDESFKRNETDLDKLHYNNQHFNEGENYSKEIEDAEEYEEEKEAEGDEEEKADESQTNMRSKDDIRKFIESNYKEGVNSKDLNKKI